MMIHDENKLKYFFDTVFPAEWKMNEVAFISLVARNKYSDVPIKLGNRSEMLDKNVVKTRNFTEYLGKIRRLTSNGYFDAEDNEIPDCVKTIYVNINLSDASSVWIKTKDEMNKIEFEALSHLINHQPDISHVMKMMRNLPNIWYSRIQNTFSKKRWLDIDIDTSDEIDFKSTLLFNLKNNFVVKTRGGYHVLLNCIDNQFNGEVNPESIRKSVEGACGSGTKEVILNKGAMIPCPGTYQAGYPVDFKKLEEYF